MTNHKIAQFSLKFRFMNDSLKKGKEKNVLSVYAYNQFLEDETSFSFNSEKNLVLDLFLDSNIAPQSHF